MADDILVELSKDENSEVKLLINKPIYDLLIEIENLERIEGIYQDEWTYKNCSVEHFIRESIDDRARALELLYDSLPDDNKTWLEGYRIDALRSLKNTPEDTYSSWRHTSSREDILEDYGLYPDLDQDEVEKVLKGLE